MQLHFRLSLILKLPKYLLQGYHRPSLQGGECLDYCQNHQCYQKLGCQYPYPLSTTTEYQDRHQIADGLFCFEFRLLRQHLHHLSLILLFNYYQAHYKHYKHPYQFRPTLDRSLIHVIHQFGCPHNRFGGSLLRSRFLN